MTTPGHRIWLISLALALAVTSGHRLLDQIAVEVLIGGNSPDGSLIGALILPFVAALFWAALSCILLTDYPPRPIKLFRWWKGGVVRQSLWTVFFGLLMLMPILEVCSIASSMGKLLDLDDDGRVARDAACNLIASVGAVYLCLCFRALACDPQRGSRS